MRLNELVGAALTSAERLIVVLEKLDSEHSGVVVVAAPEVLVEVCTRLESGGVRGSALALMDHFKRSPRHCR